MERTAVSGVILVLLLTSVISSVLIIQPVEPEPINPSPAQPTVFAPRSQENPLYAPCVSEPESSSHHWVGAMTSQGNQGIMASIQVTNPDVQRATTDYFAAWIMEHQYGPDLWISVGWGEVGWRDDKQYIWVHDTQYNEWFFYDQYSISPGDWITVALTYQEGTEWAAWLWDYSKSDWICLHTVDVGFSSPQYTSQFGEVYATEGSEFYVPDTSFHNTSLLITGSWNLWDTRYYTYEYNPDPPYDAHWLSKYWHWYMHSGEQAVTQPRLKAPWKGIAKISQGNNGTMSHYDHGTWDNTYAIDVAVPVGSDVLAPANGVVEYVDNNPGGGGGKELAIEHTGQTGKKFVSVYLHLSDILVEEGRSVYQGQVVAKSGDTGNVTGPHLHFHLWRPKESPPEWSYDAHTMPTERLVMKQVGVDDDFREYNASRGELDDAKIAGKLFESNNNYFNVSVYTDKYMYHSGDTMHLGLNVTNHNSIKYLCFAVWVELPDSSIYIYTHKHSVLLPIGTVYHDPAFDTIVLPSVPSGTYTWHAAFLERETHTIIAEDTAEWEFV